MKTIKTPSKYYHRRIVKPTAIIIHYISARYTLPENPYDMEEILLILNEYKLSYHEIIGRSGVCYELVSTTNTAYHAGHANLFGRVKVNDRSIGLAYVGRSEDHPTEAQYINLASRCRTHLRNNPTITPNWILGHDMVSGDWVRGKGKGKKDPGDTFDWSRLYSIIFKES